MPTRLSKERASRDAMAFQIGDADDDADPATGRLSSFLRFGNNGANTLELTTTTSPVVTGTWSHVTMTYVTNTVGGTLTLYVNGMQEAQTTHSDAVNSIDSSSAVNNLVAGLFAQDAAGSTGLRNRFHGQIDDLGIWGGRAAPATPTPLEIAAIHGLGRFAGSALNDTDIDQVLAAFGAGPGNAASAGGHLWTYVPGLSGGSDLGAIGGSIAGEDAFIILDDLGNGMQLSGAPIIISFTASDGLLTSDTILAVTNGAAITLEWHAVNQDTVTIDQGVPAISGSTGTVVVTATSDGTYTLTATNLQGVSQRSITVLVDPIKQEPVINEFIAKQDALEYLDENGEASDWIELWNPNPFPIHLGGYYLTDRTDQPTQWRIPDGTSLAADDYLIIFASGKNRAVAGSELHTNFGLNQDEEYLGLIQPDGINEADAYAPVYPDQQPDISYGVEPNGPRGYLAPPTPGAANGTAFAGFIADTRFDPDRGYYSSNITVTITSDTLGATIVYTTDGSDPTLDHGTTIVPPNTNSLSVATVAIGQTTVLRAAAYKEGLRPTNVDTHTYLFLADVIQQPEMDPDVVTNAAYASGIIPALKDIPTLSVVTNPSNLFDNAIGILANKQGRGPDWERPVSVELIRNDGINGFQEDAGIRVHGNGSRGNPKNALRLFFRGDYGARKLNYPFFGVDWVDAVDTLVLRAQNANSWTSTRGEDRTSTTFIQDSFARDTQTAFGDPTTGSTFVHLYLNGTYWGLYNPVERPDGPFGEDHFGGEEEDYDAINRRFSVEILDGSKDFWDEMIAFTQTDLSTTSAYATIQTYMDIDNLIETMLIHQFMQTRDGPDDFGYNNMRLLRRNNPSGLFQNYSWDMEYSMIDTTGTRNYTYPYPIYSSPRTTSRDITDSIASLYIPLKDNNPEFRLHYADLARKHLFNGGALTEAAAAARFEARAEIIEEAVIGESARWGDQRRAAQPYTRDGEWTTERNRLLTEFFPQRPAHVIGQLQLVGLYPMIAAPDFNQHGGQVDPGFDLMMNAPSGTIYYTTDGSDPRVYGHGTVSPLALAYTNAVPLNMDAEVNARTFDGTEWSALTAATFLAGIAANSNNLVVSELMYNPAGPDDGEFIELMNISTNTINLSQVTLQGAVTFTFPINATLATNARLVLVKDAVAFQAIHGSNTVVAGTFADAFDNDGEEVRLLAADGGIIQHFTYSDRHPWPEDADGNGYSLVLIAPEQNPDHDIATNWRASVTLDGNPTSSDATTFIGDPLEDDNADGVSNLQMYALGTGPDVALIDGRVIFSYERNLAADDVDLTPEISFDLQNWSSAPETIEYVEEHHLGNGMSAVSYRVTDPENMAVGRAYLRLKVVLRP